MSDELRACPNGFLLEVDDTEVGRLQSEIARLTARVKELEDANRWIPVSERLPEKVDLVMCYAPHFSSIDFRWSDQIGEAVTHWKPMPDVPQED